MTGTVFFHLDHTAPVDAMREKLRDILRECPAWDGRACGLAVTDTTPNTMQVRALVTAKDADDIWTVRCRGPRADDPLAVRGAPVRAAARQHRRTPRCLRAAGPTPVRLLRRRASGAPHEPPRTGR